MIIPTEPIGSIPRPAALVEALSTTSAEDPALDALYALRKIAARVAGTRLAANVLGHRSGTR
jgi:hypothetical protein